MAGESPLSMMRAESRMPIRQAAVPGPRRRRFWPIVMLLAAAIVLALGWCWLWYYAAAIADRTLTGWVAREAKAGRSYTCNSQSISGFPFDIRANCVDAAAAINGNQPPFAAAAKAVTFIAQVFRPTQLIGEITSPLTVATAGQPPSFVANWSLARIGVHGVPPQPDSFFVTLETPRLRQPGTAGTLLFAADHVDFDARIVDGSPSDHPVIGASLRFGAVRTPTVHPLLAEPLSGEMDVVLHGLKDLSPKSWAARFREIQLAGGNIEIKALRVERSDATLVGTGTLTLNEHGKLDGLIRVAVAGVEHIVPLLGVDRLIGRGIDRLAGSANQDAQGLGALDRLLPGLSGAVRQGANATVVDNLKKMGQPTEIDKKPAVLLPLRIADGSVYLGMIPLGEIPPLF